MTTTNKDLFGSTPSLCPSPPCPSPVNFGHLVSLSGSELGQVLVNAKCEGIQPRTAWVGSTILSFFLNWEQEEGAFSYHVKLPFSPSRLSAFLVVFSWGSILPAWTGCWLRLPRVVLVLGREKEPLVHFSLGSGLPSTPLA